MSAKARSFNDALGKALVLRLAKAYGPSGGLPKRRIGRSRAHWRKVRGYAGWRWMDRMPGLYGWTVRP